MPDNVARGLPMFTHLILTATWWTKYLLLNIVTPLGYALKL